MIGPFDAVGYLIWLPFELVGPFEPVGSFDLVVSLTMV